jgi:hypothetical protein
MNWKEFLKPTKFKILVFLILLLFFPSFFISIGILGFASLLWMFFDITDYYIANTFNYFSYLGLFGIFLFFVQASVQCYLMSCLLNRYLKNKIILIILFLLIFIVTIFPFYQTVNVAGGGTSNGILEMIEKTSSTYKYTQDLKKRKNLAILNDNTKICDYINSNEEFTCLNNDQNCSIFDKGSYLSVIYYCYGSGGDLKYKDKFLIEINKETMEITNKGLYYK